MRKLDRQKYKKLGFTLSAKIKEKEWESVQSNRLHILPHIRVLAGGIKAIALEMQHLPIRILIPNYISDVEGAPESQ